MKKNLLYTFFLTGVAHSINFLSLFIFLQKLTKDEISKIALFEASIFLTIGLISLGIEQYAAREIVNNKQNVKEIITTSQGFRLTLSLTIFSYGLFSVFIENNFSALLLAPFLALNNEYVLYAIGRPIAAALSSFVKVSLPSITLIALAYLDVTIDSKILLVSYGTAIIASGLTGSFLLKTPYLFKPRLLNRQSFMVITGIAFFSFLITSARNSFVLIVNSINNEWDVSIIYSFAKLYLIVFSLRRIVVQVVYSTLIDDIVAARTNKFMFIFQFAIALSIFLLAIFLNDSLLQTLNLSSLVLYFISISIFAGSIFTIYPTKLLVDKQDLSFVKASSAAFTIFLVILVVSKELKLSEAYALLSIPFMEIIFGFSAYLFYMKKND